MARISRCKTSDIIDVTYGRNDNAIDRMHERALGNGNLSSRFRDKLQSKITDFKNNRHYRTTVAAARKLKYGNQRTGLSLLTNVGEFQHASNYMIDVLMASPRVSSLVHSGRAEGWGSRGRRTSRSSYKATDSMYRAITSGTLVDNESITYVLTDDESRKFTSSDKLVAKMSWDNINEILWQKLDDPTSKFNAVL